MRTRTSFPWRSLRNHDGKFVKPSIETVSAAAEKAVLPDDYRVSITDAPGASAYPISAFTYLLVYQDQPDAAKGEALVRFLWWAVHDGQKLARRSTTLRCPRRRCTRWSRRSPS